MAARRYRCPLGLPPDLSETESVGHFTGAGGSRYGSADRRGLRLGVSAAAESIEVPMCEAGAMPPAMPARRHSS